MLHGATTAVFAMLSHTAAERHRDRGWLMFVPGWIAALIIHIAFNSCRVSTRDDGDATARAPVDRAVGVQAQRPRHSATGSARASISI
jgi:hypothetical protein